MTTFISIFYLTMCLLVLIGYGKVTADTIQTIRRDRRRNIPSSVQQIDVLAYVLYKEAGGEGNAGIRAVAEAVRNRGGDPFEQVLRRKQFSCLNGMSRRRVLDEAVRLSQTTRVRLSQTTRAINVYSFCRFIATQLLDTTYKGLDLVKGATHYCALDTYPSWAKTATFCGVIGNHKFYKLK